MKQSLQVYGFISIFTEIWPQIQMKFWKYWILDDLVHIHYLYMELTVEYWNYTQNTEKWGVLYWNLSNQVRGTDEVSVYETIHAIR